MPYADRKRHLLSTTVELGLTTRELRNPISSCGSNARYRVSYKLKKEMSNAERSMPNGEVAGTT